MRQVMQIVTIVTRRPAKTPPKAGEFATVGTMTHPGKTAALAKMQSAGISGAAQDAFARAFDRFIAGESALIAETDIDRISHVTNAADLPEGDPETDGTQTDSSETGDPQTDGSQFSEANTYNPHTFNPHTLSNVAVLMLNGGLGTTMGLDTTKSLLEAHAGLNFLEIVIRQLDNLRKRFNVQLPLILLNSDKTECETRAALPPHAAESILQYAARRTGVAEAQRAFAEYGYRPVDAGVAQEVAGRFPAVTDLFTVRGLGGWPEVQKTLFAPGALYDRVARATGARR